MNLTDLKEKKRRGRMQLQERLKKKNSSKRRFDYVNKRKSKDRIRSK
jgi:hypothetical protein